MRHFIFYLLIVLIPTGVSAKDDGRHIGGTYYNEFAHIEIRIKPHRRGIKAKINGHRWRTYRYIGDGVFDDHHGRLIIDLGHGRIEFNQRYRTTLVLSRLTSIGDYRYEGIYGEYDGHNYRGNGFGGDWYCEGTGLSLSLEILGHALRIRRHGSDWVYYNRYNDHEYRDRYGNRYYLDGDDLIWFSKKHRRSLRFKRR